MVVREVMRYITSDDSEFETEEKADEHEIRLNNVTRMASWLQHSVMYLGQGHVAGYEEVAEFLFDNKTIIKEFFDGK